MHVNEEGFFFFGGGGRGWGQGAHGFSMYACILYAWREVLTK